MKTVGLIINSIISSAVLYYRTYFNSQINRVDLNNENLDSDKLIDYPLVDEENFNLIN